MTPIVAKIDEYTILAFPGYEKKLWGFCELAQRTKDTSQPIPMTVTGTDKRLQVSLDDKKDFITWIRWIDSIQFSDSVEWSFGRKRAKAGNITLRIILAHKVTLGEMIVVDFVKGLPQAFNIAGYKLVNLSGYSINPDHETIYLNELGDNSYDRHRTPWNLYAIDLGLNVLIC